MPSTDATKIGNSIGALCLKLLSELTPSVTSFETEMEAFRFIFGVGIVNLTFAKQITAASVHPSICRAVCDGIEVPFVTWIKQNETHIDTVAVAEFLLDPLEQDLFCRTFKSSKQDLLRAHTKISVIFDMVYGNRERQYYADLVAARKEAATITDGALSVMGDSVFLFKRFMLHVYGLQTNMRDRFIEEELFETGRVALCGLIFGQSYESLCSYVDYSCANLDAELPELPQA